MSRIAIGALLVALWPGCGPSLPPAADVHDLRVPEDAPSRGPADAPVVIQVFTDFQCPFCRDLVPTLQRIEREYGDRVRFVYRSYPLRTHVYAEGAAEAAFEVYRQAGDEAFWRFHDMLFQDGQRLSHDALVSAARELSGVDADAVSRAIDTRTHQDRIVADMEALRATGDPVGTPATFINGRKLVGALPYAEYRRVIEAEL